MTTNANRARWLAAAAAVLFARPSDAGTCAPPCQEGQTCVVDQCVWGCGSVTGKGCCHGDIAVVCGYYTGIVELIVNECPSYNGHCGWNSVGKDYGCGTDFPPSDPSGTYPRECDFTCVPRCSNRECGSDGCGGSCGTCGTGQVCQATEKGDRKCCTPQCEGKNCGDDGCGGSCGTCEEGQTCHPLLDRCLWCNSVPENGCCSGPYVVRCSWNGAVGALDCGTTCGWDPDASEYACDTEGGSEPTGKYPKECDFVCKPQCAGAECGSDGCGGSCGTCGAGQVCTDGTCCTPSCPSGDWSCGADGCGGSCGDCPDGFWCTDLKKCVYGYGCVQKSSPRCQGCGCEECVCGMDPACCEDRWDWKCTYECQHHCGGCVPCRDQECPAPPDLPDQQPDLGHADGSAPDPQGEEAGPGAPDDASVAPEPAAPDVAAEAPSAEAVESFPAADADVAGPDQASPGGSAANCGAAAVDVRAGVGAWAAVMIASVLSVAGSRIRRGRREP
ncbi:MAG: hypothetical protein FJ087_05205 [Deltaproteobacteria bacterium]|nr:hypothetical protein [Deltaproteobacteria bacterium]